MVGLEQAEHGAHQGGLAGPVGADQGDDLAAMHLQLRAFQHVLVGKAHMDVIQPQQYLAHAAFRQFEQSPTTSTVWPSTEKPTLLAALSMASAMAGRSSSMAVWQRRQMRNWP